MISTRLAGHRARIRCGEVDSWPNTGLITRVEGELFYFIDDDEPYEDEIPLTREYWQVVEVNPHEPSGDSSRVQD